jgi:septum formation protein
MILCSNSPRRKQLLASAGYDFKTKAFDTDESFPKNLEVSQIASFIAKKRITFIDRK